MANKTTCPITRPAFLGHSKPLEVTINGVPHVVSTKEFSTGSFGWYMNGKQTVLVNGVPCTVQVGLTLTVVGSKETPGANVVAGKVA